MFNIQTNPLLSSISMQICVDHINTKSYIDTITYGSALIVGYILMGFVLKTIGRKASISIGLTLAGACAVALVFIKDEVVIVVCFCLYLVLPGLCVSILSGAVVDLVPTHLRGKAVCICLMLGRTGSVFGSNIIGILLESYCSLTFGVFSGFVLGEYSQVLNVLLILNICIYSLCESDVAVTHLRFAIIA